MGTRAKTPTKTPTPMAPWITALATVREHFAEARPELSGPSVESLCRQAGCAAWNVLKGADWPIPNLPAVLRESPIDVLYGDEYPHPETGEILLEADEVASFHTWWWALIRWLSEQPDIPVTLPGRTLSDLRHHVLHNMDHYGGFAFIPAPNTDELAEDWPHIRLASIQTIDYVRTLAVRGPEADRAVEPVRDILTVAQTADLLGVSTDTAMRLITDGKLKATEFQGRSTGGKPRRTYRVKRAWVDDFMNKNVRPTPPSDARAKTPKSSTDHDYFS